MEKTVTRSQQEENAFDPNGDGVIVRTMDGKINSWNHRAAELYGWRKEEAIGRISHDLFQTQFPIPLEEIQSELVRKGQWEGKLVHTTRDGGRMVVESRWALDPTGSSDVVFEINRISDPGDPHAETVADTVRIQIDPPEGKLIRPDELLAKIARITDLILISGGVLATLLTFYVIYYYSWEAERQLPNIVGRLLYSLPAGVAILLFSATRLKASHKVNVTLVILACTTVIYGAEILLELIDTSRPIWLMEGLSKGDKEKTAKKIAEQFGVKFDTRDRLEVLTELSKQGLQAVPAILPRVLLVTRQNSETIREPSDLALQIEGGTKSAIDIKGKEVIPLGGVANKLTVMCNESGQWVTYSSDEHGFNNPKGIWQSGQIEIATLGDSFTQGYCVPPEKGFVGLIRRKYPETLNLGMAANGPLYMLASLQEYLPGFKPKVVLWCYFEGNDLLELQVENKSALLMRYLNAGFSQDLVREQNEIDVALIQYIQREAAKELRKPAAAESSISNASLNVIKLSVLRKRLGLAYGETPEENVLSSEIRGEGMSLFGKILSRAKSDVSGWGGTLYFVYLPSWSRYADHPEIGERQRGEVLSAVRNLGIPVIDIDLAFGAEPDPLSLFPFRGAGHYNENGHRLAGEEILRIISPGLRRVRS